MSTNFQANTPIKRPQLLKVPEVAQLLNVKPRTIYEMVAQNRIPPKAARLKHSSF
jgi:predicted DNA-binding transcriptional regulator AlpA